MKNKTLNRQRLYEDMFKARMLNTFASAWQGFQERGWYAVPKNGGWVIKTAL